MKKAITPYWMMAPGPTLRHAWLHHPPRLAGMVVPVLRGRWRVTHGAAQRADPVKHDDPLAKGDPYLYSVLVDEVKQRLLTDRSSFVTQHTRESA